MIEAPSLIPSFSFNVKCEKHSKKEEALAKLREGVKFDEVAREFSEDKARQGMYKSFLAIPNTAQHRPLPPS